MFVMPPIEQYLQDFGDTLTTRIMYYRTYLIHTDYVANKIAECLYLGQPVEEKYAAALEGRAEARAKIRQLEAEMNQESGENA